MAKLLQRADIGLLGLLGLLYPLAVLKFNYIAVSRACAII